MDEVVFKKHNIRQASFRILIIEFYYYKIKIRLDYSESRPKKLIEMV